VHVYWNEIALTGIAMKDTLTLLAAAGHLHASGEEAVLVTLVHTSGSTYRRPGARMLIFPGCRTIGTISGGCLESAVARQAWTLTRTAARVCFTFESAPEDDNWGPASGCHGILYLLAERIAPRERHPALEFLSETRRTLRPAILAHFFDRSGNNELTPIPALPGIPWQSEQQITLANATSRWVEHGPVAAFLEYLPPPQHLMICGAGDDAQPVARIAAELGWSVDILDTRARLATPNRFPTAANVIPAGADKLPSLLHPHSAVILMSHRFADDTEFLAKLFQYDPLPYIGLLGPRRRTDRMLEELAARGIAPSPRQCQTLRTPIGLDIGSNSPETIALAIIAEIQAAFAHRDAHPLSSRAGPIHPAPFESSLK
jgi:xanthine dehydrogenase accessory factor